MNLSGLDRSELAKVVVVASWIMVLIAVVVGLLTFAFWSAVFWGVYWSAVM